jgi:hypothetical protein
MTSTPSSRPDCAGFPDTDGEWVFDWTTAAVGMFQREQSGWVMRGRPNASPDTGWVVAHDVFHHRPGDTGTYAEEVMTFGAEAWLDLDDGPDALGKSLSTSWFSVMALVVENGTRGVEGVVISRPANPDHLLHSQAGFFEQVYHRALAEFQEAFGDHEGPEFWDDLAGPQMTERAVSLAVEGFAQAQQRWPDRAQALAAFEALEKMAGEGRPGDVLRVQRVGNAIQAQVESVGRRPGLKR